MPDALHTRIHTIDKTRSSVTRKRLAAFLIGLSLVSASCSNDSNSVSNETTPSAVETIDDSSDTDSAHSLANVCPETVVIQTDWYPQAEHGFVYELLGSDYEIETDKFAVTGSLVSQGKSTGVRVQINAGGPGVASDPVISRLYTEDEILLAFMGTDIAISQSEEKPTISVVAPFNINPQIIMWDPATYPDVRSISELKDANVKVIYFRNVAYMKYLVGAGILSESQVEDTYDGFPEQFVTANGQIAQQGYGTNEPYFYENVLEQWSKSIRYQYVHETGWTPYAQSLATTPEKKSRHDGCLQKLIPIIQQATVDYVTNPSRTNELIVEATRKFGVASSYDLDQANNSTQKQLTDRLVSNSPDGTLGSFDIDRVTSFIEIAVPVYQERGDKVQEGITANDLVTNEYIDPSISLPIETAG